MLGKLDLRLLRHIAGAKPPRATWAGASTGHKGIDDALGGALARGQLHEVFAAGADDAVSATAFIAMLGERLGGAAVWLREEAIERRTRLHMPGLAAIGLDPASMVFGLLSDGDAVLRAGADVLRCPDVGVAVIELWRNPRNLGLTTTRRFQLAAEASGVTALLLRIDAQPSPSAATTRWVVRSIASQPLSANAPGYPAFELELLRHRGGGQGRWRLEWDREHRCFHDIGGTALSGAVVPHAADRPAATNNVRRRAAG